MIKKSCVLIALLAVAIQAWSYDFSVESNGQLLYYNIINIHSVELTNSYHDKKADGKPRFYVQIKISFKKKDLAQNKKVAKTDNIVKYTGGVVIPETVRYKGRMYKVKSIGKYAFDGCSGLKSISIPDGVTSIGAFAFNHCEKLRSIDIPNSVISIGMGAFQGAGLTAVTIPNQIEYIERLVFSGCLSLSSVTIPNSVTSIREYAFAANVKLTNLNIPNSVTIIEQYAFNNCINLRDITIPVGVTSIGKGAFDICRNLKEITLQSKNPILLEENFFKNTMSSGIKLKVPKGCMASYQEAPGWNDVATIEEY